MLTNHQRAQKILVFLTLFCLSLLLVTPLVGIANTQNNNTSLLTSTISPAQTPENLTVGQTWNYRVTYQNDTFTSSGTFTEKITSIKNITDWSGSTQECYVFRTRVDWGEMFKVFFGERLFGAPIITVDRYINTTNFSNPRTDIQFKLKYPSGTEIDFTSYLRNATFNIYKFPLYDGLLWQTTVNQRVSGWTRYPDGTNYTKNIEYQLTIVDASVGGPFNVTVPVGTYETWQINYTNDIICDMFTYLFYFVDPIDQVQGWYSLEAGNFVKYFMEVHIIFPWEAYGNVTIEQVPSGRGLYIILPLILSYSAQQQRGSFNLLLIGGGITAVIVIAGVAIVLILRRGPGIPSPPESGPPEEWKPT